MALRVLLLQVHLITPLDGVGTSSSVLPAARSPILSSVIVIVPEDGTRPILTELVNLLTILAGMGRPATAFVPGNCDSLA